MTRSTAALSSAAISLSSLQILLPPNDKEKGKSAASSPQEEVKRSSVSSSPLYVSGTPDSVRSQQLSQPASPTKFSLMGSPLFLGTSPLHDPIQHINVRQMNKSDLQMVLDWGKQEGWNPGKHEADPLYAADPTGYRILELDGVAIASLSVVKHSKSFAWVGLYLVRKEFRGRGLGKYLWDQSMESVAGFQRVSLNAVLAQESNYAQSGFVSRHTNTRWKGIIKNATGAEEKSSDKIILTDRDFSVEQLIAYDAKIFTTPRKAFMEKWLTMPESHVFAAIENNEIKGFGVVSVSHDGYKIAPLYADNVRIAERIFLCLNQVIGNKGPIHFDTNGNNLAANAFAERIGLTKQFDVRYMCRGDVPNFDYQRSFGSATLELG